MDTIRQLWKQSGLPEPEVLLACHEHKYYVTSSDATEICFFASRKGKIYVAVKSKCKIVVNQGEYIYTIEEPGALQVISCKRPLTETDRFVVEQIIPTFASL